MSYPNYLIHYNKNHSKANGQFVSGDGDGDGISNDHAHRSKSNSKKQLTPEEKRKRRNAWIAVGAGATGTAIAAAAVFLSSKKELTYRDSNGNLNTICTPRGKQMAWKFINTVSSLGIGVRNEFKNAIHDGPNRPDSNYLI